MLALTIRLIASLAVVVGLMLLLARFTGRRMRGSRGSLVQVLHRQPLSRTSGIAVVGIGDRVLVLGTTEQSVSLITELDPEALEADADLVALPVVEDVDDLDTSSLVPHDDYSINEAFVGRVASASERIETRKISGSHRAHRRTPESGALTGSILSADTWRQAVAALGRRAS